MRKKLLAIIAGLTMLLVLIPGAVFAEPGDQCSIYYDFNGGVNSNFPEETEIEDVGYIGSEYEILESCSIYYMEYESDTHKVFSGWAFDQAGKQRVQNDTFTPTGDTRLYAVWEAGYEVTFDANGGTFDDGTSIKKRAFKKNVPSDKPWPEPEKDGYKFSHWEDENGNQVSPYDGDGYVATKDTTVHAVYIDAIKVVLHLGDGRFGWHDGDTYTDVVGCGEYLHSFSTLITDDGEAIYSREVYSPELANKLFEGWYTDQSLKNRLDGDIEVTADYISKHNGTLDLYAKYTDNYYTMTYHGNGGATAYGEETVEFRCPAEYAFDLRWAAEFYKEGKEIVGWYKDADCSTKLNYGKDNSLYKPTANEDIYLKWGDPVVENVYIGFTNRPEQIYTDRNCDIGIKFMDENDNSIGIPSNCNVKYTLKIVNGKNETVKQFESPNTDVFTGNNSKVTLKTTAIKNEIPNGELWNYTLTLCAVLVDEHERFVTSEEEINYIWIADPYTDYDLPWFYEDGERVEIILGEETYFDKNKRGKRYNSQYPNGQYFNYTIKGVTSSDTSILKVADDGDCFLVKPLKPGDASLTIKTTEKDIVIDFRVVTESYYITFDTYENSLTDIVPGGSIPLVLSVEKEVAKGHTPGDYTIEWSVDDKSKPYATITKNSSNQEKATLNLEGSVNLEDVDLSEIIVYAKLIDSKGDERTTAEISCCAKESFYHIDNLPQKGESFALGQSIKFNPTVKRYAAGVAPNGEIVNNPTFSVDCEESSIEVKDSKGKTISNNKPFKGAFTITRKTGDRVSFDVNLVDEDNEDESLAGSWYVYDALLSINSLRFGGFKDCTYSGKAFIPAVTITDDWYTLEKGKDYTVSYKNNVNVGTATVTITGKGDYYGTINKTFKINPKGTSLKKLKKGKKSFTVTWKKQATQTTGYEIQYGLKKNFKGAKKVTVKKSKTVKKTIKKLKAKKKYYVRIRTYKTVGKTKYYSAWSKAKTVKTK